MDERGLQGSPSPLRVLFYAQKNNGTTWTRSDSTGNGNMLRGFFPWWLQKKVDPVGVKAESVAGLDALGPTF